MFLIGFESSCDETAVAVMEVTENGRLHVLSDRIHSQIPLHALYGGVVPEIAGRAHIEAITPLTKSALKEANLSPKQLDAVAVTSHPGLIGALLVGVNFAKAFAFANGLPLISVDHMKAHIAAASIDTGNGAPPEPPFVALAVSGGHSSLYYVRTHTDYTEIGCTRDDAIGEAFDKAGRLLGLPYPAGAPFDRLAQRGFAEACGKPDAGVSDYRKSQAYKDKTFRLPSPALTDGTLDFSFSGLKTAAVNCAHRYTQNGTPLPEAAFAAAFTCEAVEAVAVQADAALSRYPSCPLVVAGGVAANSHLRRRLTEVTDARRVKLFIPPLSLCGDNGAMVCAQGYFEYLAGHFADASLNACACDE